MMMLTTTGDSNGNGNRSNDGHSNEGSSDDGSNNIFDVGVHPMGNVDLNHL